MELSTKILIERATKLGFTVKVIDEADNFISISNGKKTEYVKQATKTSLDNYISVLMMENKYVTNHVLREQGVRVPRGIKVDKNYDIDYVYNEFSSNVVVKPVSTNFGIGISIFDTVTKEELERAIKFALEHDEHVLIEEKIKGKEYRFLVMGDEVVGVLERVPANVVGDGKSTITELVNIKNDSPLRGEHYELPLQKIVLGEVELANLERQGFTKDSILDNNQQVFLRENSNISTGGDSIDHTDSMHELYKEKAIEATRALNVVICGVDMMIENTNEFIDYGIIELNFNPAIHIHHYPYIGTERKASEKLLKLLFG